MNVKTIIHVLWLLAFPCYQVHSYNASMKQLNKDLFNYIFKTNAWGDPASYSGPGSNLAQTTYIRLRLSVLIETLAIKSMLDAPCGDFYWMKEVALSRLDHYIGADIVEALISDNNARYATPKRTFIVRDLICDELPRVDLIFCRDCLQHLPNDQVLNAIKNFKRSGSTYLLVSQFPEVTQNIDIQAYQITNLMRCRKINLEKDPYNFPQPLALINEGFLGKHLALWRLADLP